MTIFSHGDGASAAAQAVLAYIAHHDGVENSWDNAQLRYFAKPSYARWHNCREQGYVISMQCASFKRQINIAFFEHRNSDRICAVIFEAKTINPPTLADVPDAHPWTKDKHAVDLSFDYHGATEMADSIMYELQKFWFASAI